MLLLECLYNSSGVELEDFEANLADVKFQQVLTDSIKTVVLFSSAASSGKTGNQSINIY